MAIKSVGSGYVEGGASAYSTDAKPGNSVFVGTVTPANVEVGDIWIDNSTGSSTITATEIAAIMGAF